MRIMTIIQRTRKEALAILTASYNEACDKYPLTREVPLSLYLKRNLRYAMGPFEKWIDE